MALAFAFTSCSESDDSEEEYTDWQSTNETYFDNLFMQTKMKVDAGDTSWKIYKNWTLDSGEVAKHSYDHIVVRVIKSGNSDVSPLYNDSVRVHYSGRLLPSKSYPTGYVFDKSYTGDFNIATAVPAKFVVNGTAEGFATALQHMHLGDHWEIYIPYQLGYGEEANNTIPAYSTLVFDVRLVGIYRYGTKVPDWNARLNDMWEME